VNKDEISQEVFEDAAVFVLASPREKFSEMEFNTLKKYLDTGGSLLVTLCEGGEKSLPTNINYLLEEYGIMVNSDCVVRTHYNKYFHPKECLVPNGVLNRAFPKLLNRESTNFSQAISFVYPFGATLNTARPAIPILSNGTVSFPLNRPVLAVSNLTPTSPNQQGGKIAVLGSGHLLSDKYIDKEDNSLICQFLIAYLTTDSFQPNAIDAEDPEVSEYTVVADTGSLAERLRPCLIETSQELPLDYTSLFPPTESLFRITLDIVPQVIDAFRELNMTHEPLRLIPPPFDIPLPPLQVAVFPPRFLDLKSPALDLYDLEEAFASERTTLAQAANKCLSGKGPSNEEEDVDYFLSECSSLFGLKHTSPFKILTSVALTIANFKKNLNHHD